MPPRKIKTQRKANTSKQKAIRVSRQRNVDAEKILWKHLCDGRFDGFRFERDFRIEGRVFPFFCRAANLALAIDRETPHGSSPRDYKFDTYLLARGIMVGHFGEEQIRSAPAQVAEQILFSCRNRTNARPSVAINPSAQTSPRDSNTRIAPNPSKRLAWVAGIAIAAILIALIFFLVFEVRRSFQGVSVAQKPLATLTPAPTPTRHCRKTT